MPDTIIPTRTDPVPTLGVQAAKEPFWCINSHNTRSGFVLWIRGVRSTSKGLRRRNLSVEADDRLFQLRVNFVGYRDHVEQQ